MNVIEFLKANERKGPGSFNEDARFLKDNWNWLKYSYAVAIKVRHRMKDMGLTQRQLADAIGCTQQHVSVLLNGKVNMTLETLAKLEKALEFDLIGQALSFDHQFLSDPIASEERTATGTSSLVQGYPQRKKKGPKKQ